MNQYVMTPKDEKLYAGVNRAIPPQHEKLQPGWAPPVPPLGFHNLVAILVPVTLDDGSKSHAWELDYLNTETSAFASEDLDFEVQWPWVPGYQPKPQDWDSIGIPNLT